MKKNIFFICFLVFLLNTGIIAKAEPEQVELYKLTIKMNIHEGVVFDGITEITIVNIDNTDDMYVCQFSKENEYAYSTYVSKGTYTIIDYSFYDTDAAKEKYNMDFGHCVVDGQRYENEYSFEMTYNSEYKGQPTTPTTTTNNNQTSTYKITENNFIEKETILSDGEKVDYMDENNAYFPNKTMKEICQWYVNEVDRCIKEGINTQSLSLRTSWKDGDNSKYEVEDFICELESYINRIIENKDTAALKKEMLVDFFEEDSTNICEINKKMTEFIEWYYSTYKTMPNFYFNVALVELQNYEEESTNGVVEEITTNETINEDKENTTDEQSTTDVVKITEKGVAENDTVEENFWDRFLDIAKGVVISFICMLVFVVVGIIVKIKKRKKA